VANEQVTVFFMKYGTSKTYPLERAKGLKGPMAAAGMRNRASDSKSSEKTSPPPVLPKYERPRTYSVPGIAEIAKPEARTLAAAVETFIIGRTDLNPTTAGRWRGEL
jgi:hypothetical protein